MAKLLTLPPFDAVVLDNPGLALKYLIPNYLAQGFTVAERASCFLHHYRRIHAALLECALTDIFRGDVSLHEFVRNNNHFNVTIGVSRPPFDKEGELSLSLKVNGDDIFVLTFIIAPGWVVRSEAEDVLLITGLQGIHGTKPQVRLLRSSLQEYSTRKLLLAALQGIAEAFRISELSAVCAEKQRSNENGHDACFERRYDSFFIDFGMTRTSFGFFSCSLPIVEKPIAAFRGRNRRNTMMRRAIRNQLRSAGAGFFLKMAEQADLSSAGLVKSTAAIGPVESNAGIVSCSASNSNSSI